MKPISKQTKKVNRDELNIEDKKWKKKTKSKNRKKNYLSESRSVVGNTSWADEIKNVHSKKLRQCKCF
jgi:hypothetical protein